jgi:hypothetical protein
VNIILLRSEFGLGIAISINYMNNTQPTMKSLLSSLVIDMEESADKRFRKGLLEILDLHR